jgi:outer membrane protein insertion porin family
MGYKSKTPQKLCGLADRQILQTGIRCEKYQERSPKGSGRTHSGGTSKGQSERCRYGGDIDKTGQTLFEKNKKINQGGKRGKGRNNLLKVALLSSFFITSYAFSQETVSSVKVVGNKYLTDKEVLKLLNLRKGIVFSEDYIYRSIKEAYKKGAFEYIGIFKENRNGKLNLLVKVKDLPVVYDVQFIGNEEVKEEELRQAIGVPENPQELLEQQTSYISGPAIEEKLKLKKLVPIGRPLTVEEIEEMVRRIKLLYAQKGFSDVKVTYKLVPIKGASKLVFYIEEGKQKYVSDIEIRGLRKLDEDDVRDVMLLEEPNIFLFRFHPPYSKELLEHDIEAINQLLKDKGFFEGKVKSYKAADLGDGAVKVIIDIYEGPRYKIGKVTIKGNTYFGYRELTKKFFKKLNKKDGYYDKKLVDYLKEQILTKYKNLGLYYTKVAIIPHIDKQKKVVNLEVLVRESPPTYNRWVEVKGNYETRDYVIRRELELHEGDLITEERIKWSKIWIDRLGYYAGVEIKPELLAVQNKKAYTKTKVKVTERFTGQFSVGVGYSETSGLSGFISVKKGNFLGTGDIVGVAVSFGEFEKNYRFSYTRKWFMKKPQDLSFAVYDYSHNYDTYDISRKGISTTLTRRFWHYWRWHIGLDLESVDYSDISPDASIYVKESAKFSSATILRLGVERDTRDSYLFPSEGDYLGAFTRIGGVFGGDERFVKLRLKGSKYFKDEYFDTGTILSIKGQFGWIEAWGGKDVTPIDERFFVGGDYTIRGYKYGYAGPVDPETEDPVGAKKMWVASAEADYPIKKKTFYLAAFTDVGNGANNWSDLVKDIKAGVGFGIRFVTPMAPIRLDFAWKLKKVKGDTNNFRIHVVIGSFF